MQPVLLNLLSVFSVLLTLAVVGAFLWFVFTIGPLLRRWLERELSQPSRRG